MYERRNKLVSVIVPTRNEEKYIERCIQSILNQDYPRDYIEVLFVDGLSNDKTKEIIIRYAREYPKVIKLLDNPKKTAPYAMNIGINNSKGKYIVRLDAHSEYSSDYISKCITTIIDTGADNVGGLVITKSYGVIGDAFSKVLSSRFGVGNSGFRTNASSGYVDTVPFGTFKRETFEKYGLYDERLTRNQDYELNYRIRKNGGKIYLNSDIKIVYYCRNTLLSIVKQSYENGKWNIITSKLCPGSMSVRHFVPLFFILSIFVLPSLAMVMPIFLWAFLLEVGSYFMLNIFFSQKLSAGIRQFLLLFILFPLFHVSYGLGSLTGLVSRVKTI